MADVRISSHGPATVAGPATGVGHANMTAKTTETTYATSPPRVQVRDGLTWIAFSRTYAVHRDRVWRALTSPRVMAAWIGPWAGDPTLGGVQVDFLDGSPPVSYEVLRVDPGHAFEVASVSPYDGSRWPVTARLSDTVHGTVLEFAQGVLEPGHARGVAVSTEYYLARLAAVLEQRDPETVSYDDLVVETAPTYRALFPTQRRA